MNDPLVAVTEWDFEFLTPEFSREIWIFITFRYFDFKATTIIGHRNTMWFKNFQQSVSFL